jgi:hypothetical protein
LKTLALNEEFTLLFPLKTTDTTTVSSELKEHRYEFSIKMSSNGAHPTLSVKLHDFAHAQLLVELILSIVTDHNDILEYMKDLKD